MRLLLLLLLTLPAVAQDQDFAYTTNNGTITITGYTGPGGAVSIPATINGLPVTSIGELAFNRSTSLMNVTIPSSVTSIGNVAFFRCTSLLAFAVDAASSTYRSVDGVVFNKSGNTLIQYPGGRTGTYIIPRSVTTIGREAFYGCNSLTSVTIPTSVTTIGSSAFSYCTNLTSVTIPSSVSSIRDWAFLACNSLKGVYFEGNAPGFGTDVFDSVTPTLFYFVYYLPGTAGWGLRVGDRSTALWVRPNPVILNNGPSFGVQTNRFGFIISWATNRPVVVEACTDPTQPVWSPVGTNTLTSGSSYFSDPQWTNHPARFYRLRSP